MTAHDAGTLGAAVPEEVWRRRLEKLKEAGTNAIRTSHNPADPVLLDLCDEMGFLVMDEAFDEWEYPKRNGGRDIMCIRRSMKDMHLTLHSGDDIPGPFLYRGIEIIRA